MTRPPRKTAKGKAPARKAPVKSKAKSKAKAKTRIKGAASPATKRKTAAPARPKAKPRAAKPRIARAPKPKLDRARRTLALIEKLLDEHQAEDVAVLDLAGKTTVADFMVVASGRNPRHIGAMADHLKMRIKGATGQSPPVEGLGSADWILVDAGDVIVHLFRPEVRSAYNLEKMWGADWSGEAEGG